MQIDLQVLVGLVAVQDLQVERHVANEKRFAVPNPLLVEKVFQVADLERVADLRVVVQRSFDDLTHNALHFQFELPLEDVQLLVQFLIQLLVQLLVQVDRQNAGLFGRTTQIRNAFG